MNDIRGYIVVPAFNESEGISQFLADLQNHLEDFCKTTPNFKFMILLVDDGSKDNTSEIVERFAKTLHSQSVSLEKVQFIKNFGHQAAIIAGLLDACERSDFVITIDADGEQPIELISTLISKWQSTFTIIHTKRLPSSELSFFKRATSQLYYRLISFGSGISIIAGMADYKLWDSSVLRQTKSFLPHCGSTRVFAMWLAPEAPVVEYQQKVIKGRVSRYSFKQMFSFGLGGLIRYSDLPLRFSLFFGFAVLGVSFVLTVFAVWAYFAGRTLPGWASLMLIVGFFGGVNALLIGLLSEYLLQLSFRTNFPRDVRVQNRFTLK
jgi:dolichol-phosphate mannosyltransferase